MEGKKLGSLQKKIEEGKKGEKKEEQRSRSSYDLLCTIAVVTLGRGGHKKGESVMDGGAKIIMGQLAPLAPASQQKRLKRSRGFAMGWGGEQWELARRPVSTFHPAVPSATKRFAPPSIARQPASPPTRQPACSAIRRVPTV